VGLALYKRGLSLLAGVAALVFVAVYGAPRLTAGLPQTRTISLYNIHTKETITVEYKKDGKYVPAAMEKINWILRDWRKNEATQMDPALIDLLWEIHTELGSEEPIHIISGYRSRATNDMLRKTRGGQAKQSRHILGKAADVHFPDVPLRRLRYSALVRERGGVGYYPTSAIPFVHVDTDRVRAWPRLPRYELALLFPDGRTKHIPADGRPLTPEDVHEARKHHSELAAQVAAYQELRKAALSPTRIAKAEPVARDIPRPGSRIAAAWQQTEPQQPSHEPANAQEKPLPKLVAGPRPAIRPPRVANQPSDEDRMKLAQLAALASLSSVPSGARLMQASLKADEPLPEERLTGSVPGTDQSSNTRLAALDFEAGGQPAPGRFHWGVGWTTERKEEIEPTTPTGWAVAPEYDEEHPEELSYRPFPIIPYLTETPSPDDPALARMEHPDVAKTLELLDNTGDLPVMQLRAEPQTAQLLWAQQFQGEAVPLASVFGARPPAAPSGLNERHVRLSAR